MQSSLTYTYLYWLPVAPEALKQEWNTSEFNRMVHSPLPRHMNFPGMQILRMKKINPDGRQFEIALETIIQTWKEILVVVKTKLFYWSLRMVY